MPRDRALEMSEACASQVLAGLWPQSIPSLASSQLAGGVLAPKVKVWVKSLCQLQFSVLVRMFELPIRRNSLSIHSMESDSAVPLGDVC
ncbi:Uncharacterised protein [Mycobacteroides abscessus subsp. abscessus]|nr:Uncharacterised protein [Mycobacteroides abscessus subsp. abscessus]